MDRDTQTSFIPKKVLTRGVETMPLMVNLPTVVAVLVLVISLGLWGGTFAYSRWLTNSVESPCAERSTVTGVAQSCGLKESINRARQDLDQATTVFLKRLSDKLLIGNELVRSHQTAAVIFRMLEELTLPSIYYTRLAYTVNALTIEGRAASYEDVAVQTQIFSRDRGRIKSFIFSDLDLDSLGNVVFKLVINVEPGMTSYDKYLATLNSSRP